MFWAFLLVQTLLASPAFPAPISPSQPNALLQIITNHFAHKKAGNNAGLNYFISPLLSFPFSAAPLC